jgi:hypothetical protein
MFLRMSSFARKERSLKVLVISLEKRYSWRPKLRAGGDSDWAETVIVIPLLFSWVSVALVLES